VFLLGSIAVVAAAIFGSEWLVENWLGEARRFWVALAGIGIMVLASAVIQTSGIHAVTRILRKLVIGAVIGRALNGLGTKLPWLRRGLWLAGFETEPEAGGPQELQWSAFRTRLLVIGWFGAMTGTGMMWSGIFAG
jgi:hypothetical protein